MPKYWVKNYFAHGRFPEVGQKQKTEKKKKKASRLDQNDYLELWTNKATDSLV